MGYEYFINRTSREKYNVDSKLFSPNGKLVLPNLTEVRKFAGIFSSPDIHKGPLSHEIKLSEFSSMGLLDEIFHYIISRYIKTHSTVVNEALEIVEKRLTKTAIDEMIYEYHKQFPSPTKQDLFDRRDEVKTKLNGIYDLRNSALIEIILLKFTNINPALEKFNEFFDDSLIDNSTIYMNYLEILNDFFKSFSVSEDFKVNVVKLLKEPIEYSPYSIQEQLEYIRLNWSKLIEGFQDKLLISSDLYKEELTSREFQPQVDWDIQEIEVSHFSEAEPRSYSQDEEWMPNLVLIAKNTYVWLAQLSEKYQKQITKLDEIPDDEFQFLADYGINGLWLIGIWERSKASQNIKNLCGNSDAESSAYAVKEYNVSSKLGGYNAYAQLKEKANRYGIRLAADMVPNHFGIDSPSVTNNSQAFVSLDYAPYPSYKFLGPQLSTDPSLSIKIEDHYYDRSDAAVVFQFIDYRTNTTKYIYHGNDGTSMPWNDTAQLNYLLPEVREMIINEIIGVARMFPIIRFDAAMTLTKKHFRRLWYPEPGTGGAIPTRTEHGLSKAEFDKLFPKEFWREVVQRVQSEVPDTLLLAEAFWLMEGYFVRSLGMHRVYNSAFMHMLRDENNVNYRKLIKETLTYDPQIFQRYVNFMSNPDEESALTQFGDNDKYFGICTLLATLPGLPMLGHGQIEGLSEKYGMEFSKPRLNEQSNLDLLYKHSQQIAPLLKKRHIFSGVENFRLYDFKTDKKSINDDVFAFSNKAGNDFQLIIYHNKWAETSGWVNSTCPFNSSPGDESATPIQSSLIDELNFLDRSNPFFTFKDLISGLSYIRKFSEIKTKGLHVDLKAYTTYVFHEFTQDSVYEQDQLNSVWKYLGGNGTTSISSTLNLIEYSPIVTNFDKLFSEEFVSEFVTFLSVSDSSKIEFANIIIELLKSLQASFPSIQFRNTSTRELSRITKDFALGYRKIIDSTLKKDLGKYSGIKSLILDNSHQLLLYFLLSTIFSRIDQIDAYDQLILILDEINFEDWVTKRNLDSSNENTLLLITTIIFAQQNLTLASVVKSEISLLDDEKFQQYIGVNEYQGILWYDSHHLISYFLTYNILAAIFLAKDLRENETPNTIVEKLTRIVNLILDVDKQSEYKYDAFKNSINQLSDNLESKE